LPPYVVSIHGGPTGQATPDMSARTSFFTSQGIGVLEVNYGGSTGFGRAWRNRLRGQWGFVDVGDTVAAVDGLVAAGPAAPAGSTGGPARQPRPRRAQRTSSCSRPASGGPAAYSVATRSCGGVMRSPWRGRRGSAAAGVIGLAGGGDSGDGLADPARIAISGA